MVAPVDCNGTPLLVGQKVAFSRAPKGNTLLTVGEVVRVTAKGAYVKGAIRTPILGRWTSVPPSVGELFRKGPALAVVDEGEDMDGDPHIGCPSYPECDEPTAVLGCLHKTPREDVEWYGHR